MTERWWLVGRDPLLSLWRVCDVRYVESVVGGLGRICDVLFVEFAVQLSWHVCEAYKVQ
jgi:hypothetical protein